MPNARYSDMYDHNFSSEFLSHDWTSPDTCVCAISSGGDSRPDTRSSGRATDTQGRSRGDSAISAVGSNHTRSEGSGRNGDEDSDILHPETVADNDAMEWEGAGDVLGTGDCPHAVTKTVVSGQETQRPARARSAVLAGEWEGCSGSDRHGHSKSQGIGKHSFSSSIHVSG